MDMDTLDIVNTYTYAANLTAANANGAIDWTLEYTATGLYGLTSLGPQDWHAATTRLATEPDLFQAYYEYKYKGYLGGRTCATDECVDAEVCRLRTSYVGQPGCAA